MLSSSLKIISFSGETVLSNRLLRAVERILSRRRNFVEYRFDTDVVDTSLVHQLLLKKRMRKVFVPTLPAQMVASVPPTQQPPVRISVGTHKIFLSHEFLSTVSETKVLLNLGFDWYTSLKKR